MEAVNPPLLTPSGTHIFIRYKGKIYRLEEVVLSPEVELHHDIIEIVSNGAVWDIKHETCEKQTKNK